MSTKGQNTATYLVPRRVLDLVEGDHVTVVSESHVETSKYLSLIIVQVGGVSQLTRDMGEKRRRLSLTTRRRALAGGHTGGKNQCPEMEHCKYTVSKWTM